jgi:transposase
MGTTGRFTRVPGQRRSSAIARFPVSLGEFAGFEVRRARPQGSPSLSGCRSVPVPSYVDANPSGDLRKAVRDQLAQRAIATALEVCHSTVARVRQQYAAGGLAAAVDRKAPEREYLRRLDGEQEARLAVLACSTPPEGRKRWTLRLLAERLVQLEVVDAVSHETVRQALKQTGSSRG